MQVKRVLSKQLVGMMLFIMGKDKETRYDLELPDKIPTSSIAAQLNQHFVDVEADSEKNSDYNFNDINRDGDGDRDASTSSVDAYDLSRTHDDNDFDSTNDIEKKENNDHDVNENENKDENKKDKDNDDNDDNDDAYGDENVYTFALNQPALHTSASMHSLDPTQDPPLTSQVSSSFDQDLNASNLQVPDLVRPNSNEDQTQTVNSISSTENTENKDNQENKENKESKANKQDTESKCKDTIDHNNNGKETHLKQKSISLSRSLSNSFKRLTLSAVGNRSSSISPRSRDRKRRKRKSDKKRQKRNRTVEDVIILCRVIITSFIQLYEKYIGDSAEYQINIHSKRRKKLTAMLDRSTFERQTRTRGGSIAIDSQIQLSQSKQSKNDEIIYNNNNNDDSESNNKIKIYFGNSNLSYVGISQELETFCNDFQIDKNDYKSMDDFYAKVLSWLLIQLIVTMEKAVCEIAVLMGDSYSRFRSNQKLLEACIEAAKNVKNM